MRRLILFALAVSLFNVCQAATTSWVAFDFDKCIRWAMTPDDFVGDGPAFVHAKKLAEKLNKNDNSRAWFVVEAVPLFEESGPAYGVCTGENPMECAITPRFPLSGATYREKKFKTFSCISGCSKTSLSKFLDMPYEDGDYSEEYAPTFKRFKKQCRDDEKQEKYFKRLNQQQRRF